jgi:hypothetical protein
MNIYNNDGKSNRRKSACGYCRKEGHNQTECPRVAEDYAFFTQSPPIIPIGISATPNTCAWFKNPKYWGEWYEKCMTAYAKQQEAKKQSTKARKRSTPKCGFCGSKKHNRRNCEDMKNYNADAIKANQNWRRTFYQRFVKQMGISEGALLNLKKCRGHGQHRTEEQLIGVVTSVNWDELSLFCGGRFSGDKYEYRDDQYVQRLQVNVQIGSENVMVNFGQMNVVTEPNNTKNLIKFSGGRWSWNLPYFVSVLSPSETLLGEEWIEDGHAKAMQFLTKKRSAEKLWEAGVTELIDLWV